MNKEETERLLVNPFYAIQISPSLTTKHEPLVSKEQWVQANVRLIKEVGAEEWLEQLLVVLESPDAA